MSWSAPIALLLLPVVGLMLWLGRRALGLAGGLRAVVLVALVLALAQPFLPGSPQPAPLLVLVDQSASVAATARTAAWTAAQALTQGRVGARTAVGAFGSTVRLVDQASPPDVGAAGSDLAAALRLARGWGGHTVLLSDGGATTAGTDQAAQELRQAGIVVDVVPLPVSAAVDARVGAINLPRGLREGQRFAGELVLSANAATSATLRLSQDGTEVLAQPITLPASETVVPFNWRLDRSGLHTFRATLTLSDAHVENNRLDQTILIGPPPKVLVVERTPDTAAALRDTLERGGIQTEARRPRDLPVRLQELARFDAVVLNDVAATDLSLDQQASLREYVRTLGHGLVALGGTQSYGLGKYKDTPLETVLPVDMQPPPRRERQQVALLLLVDRSASMFGVDPRTSKLELAKSAAIAATQALVPDDRVGVLVFDTDAAYAVPFTKIGDGGSLASIQNRISAIQFGGGTNIYAALATGLPDLAAQPTLVKHAVLLTDGRSYTRESYDRLIADARAAGITLSTIAIGTDADTPLLQHLAQVGGGRYHFAADPQELPQLTLKETEFARSDPRVEGTVQPAVAEVHSTLRGLVPRELPTLSGYVATTPKSSADIILRSPAGDVVLAGWQFGLGRAMAWTSDSGGQWAPNWQTWSGAPVFWSQVLGYTFPDPANGPLTVRVTGAEQPQVVAEALGPNGLPIDLADVGARVTAPDGTETTVRLRQVAPGRYTAPLSTTLVGGYRIGVALHKDTTDLSAAAGYVRPYAAEYRQPADPALLTRIAQTTGGQVYSSLPAAVAALQSAPPRPERPVWPWLIGVALGGWLLEIAARRGYLRRPGRRVPR